MAVVPNNFLLSSKALLCQYANTKLDQLSITEDNSTIEEVIPLNDELNGIPLSRVILTRNRRDVDIPQFAPLPDETNESLEYDFGRQDILVLVDDWGAGNGTIELTVEDPLDPIEVASALQAATGVSFTSTDFADITQVEGFAQFTVKMSEYSTYYFGSFILIPEV